MSAFWSLTESWGIKSIAGDVPIADVHRNLSPTLIGFRRRLRPLATPADYRIEEGLARRRGKSVIFSHDLLDTLRRGIWMRRLPNFSTETGLAHHPSADGGHVVGTYRQRVSLASGRFAMIHDGLGFQLVPYRPALEQRLGNI
jgi:hypothetical protein